MSEMGRKKERPGAELAGDIVRRLMRGRVGRRRRKEARIVEAWRDIVGEDRASKMYPVKLRAGVLWVEVPSPALFYEVSQFGREEILARVREAAPDLDVQEVRFKLG